MPGLTDAEAAAALDLFATDARYPYLGWSEDGSTETANLARTAVTWKAATSANPSVKNNNGPLNSANASGACDITHWAAFSASTSGTRRTEWTLLDDHIPLAIGEHLNIPADSCRLTLT